MKWNTPRCSAACWDEIKLADAYMTKFLIEIRDLRRDRDEWKEQHENLLAMYRTATGAKAEAEVGVREITDEMLNAHLKATNEWIEPHEAETECGVAIECGLTQEDADELNAGGREQLRKGYAAALANLPAKTDVRTNETVLEILKWPCAEQFDLAFKVAENVGYVLVREPEHPDSPHAAKTERAALEHARARFLCLAEVFEKAGDTVQWAMCSVDAERLDRALVPPLTGEG